MLGRLVAGLGLVIQLALLRVPQISQEVLPFAVLMPIVSRDVAGVLFDVGAGDPAAFAPEALAALLPNAQYVAVPGNHMSAVTKPELGRAIADFLAG